MSDFQTRLKVQAFFGEFPFLHRFANADDINEIRVRRWDNDLLNLYPAQYDPRSGTPFERSEIRLLNQRGEDVAVIGSQKPVWWNPLTWFHSDRPAYDEMYKLGDRAEQVTCAVVRQWEWDRWDECSLVVYKAPNGYANLRSWLEARSSDESQPATA